MSKVGVMIRRARKERGLSQSELSYELRKPQQVISSWENGRNEPSIKSLEQVAEYLGIDLPWMDEDEEGGDSRAKRRYRKPASPHPAYAA